jgi:hypothetical protein
MKVNVENRKLLEVKIASHRTLKSHVPLSEMAQNTSRHQANAVTKKALLEAEHKKAAAINVLGRNIFR